MSPIPRSEAVRRPNTPRTGYLNTPEEALVLDVPGLGELQSRDGTLENGPAADHLDFRVDLILGIHEDGPGALSLGMLKEGGFVIAPANDDRALRLVGRGPKEASQEDRPEDPDVQADDHPLALEEAVNKDSSRSLDCHSRSTSCLPFRMSHGAFHLPESTTWGPLPPRSPGDEFVGASPCAMHPQPWPRCLVSRHPGI